MTVTGLQGLVDSLANLARGRLPSTKAQLAELKVSDEVSGCSFYGIYVRDLVAGVECDFLTERHDFKRLKNDWKGKEERYMEIPQPLTAQLSGGGGGGFWAVQPTPLSE